MTPFYLLPVALASAGQAAAPPPRAQLERALKSWVQARVGREDADEVRYVPAFVDLNGDGAVEAVVYVGGPNRCGSGGCNAYILNRIAGRWRLVDALTVTKLPIRQLATKTHGWSDIGVYVSGGGILPGYEAVLRFNGVRYPGNPTVPPAFRARPGTPGRILIPRDSEGKRLFP